MLLNQVALVLFDYRSCCKIILIVLDFAAEIRRFGMVIVLK